MTTSSGPSSPWCCTASLRLPAASEAPTSYPTGGLVQVEMQRWAGYPVQELTVLDAETQRPVDWTQPADWMEYMQGQHQQQKMAGGGPIDDSQEVVGDHAYDTLRCDMMVVPPSTAPLSPPNQEEQDPGARWNIWGWDFHLQRLIRSYQAIQQKKHHPSDLDGDDDDETVTTLAVEHSKLLLQALLHEAEQAKILQVDSAQVPAWEDVIIQVIRFTLLWSPPLPQPPRMGQVHHPDGDAARSAIVVQAHACSSARPVQVHQRVPPIVASVAAQAQRKPTQHSSTSDGRPLRDDPEPIVVVPDPSLPFRHDRAQPKVAAWTRIRKRLQQTNTYQPPGVSEVLLVRPAHPNSPDYLEVLEGISSNLFVIYPEHRLRTAGQGVLHGYVRHLVLECAQAVGLQVELEPPILQDAPAGLWQEVFISSSSRLIYPVSKIVIPVARVVTDRSEETQTPMEVVDYWTDPAAKEDDSTTAPSKCQQLLREILRQRGYPMYC